MPELGRAAECARAEHGYDGRVSYHHLGRVSLEKVCELIERA
jgi:hypothetical protein